MGGAKTLQGFYAAKKPSRQFVMRLDNDYLGVYVEARQLKE